MIVRINLHPERKPKVKPNPYQRASLIVLAILVVEVLLCLYVDTQISDKNDALKRREAGLNQEKAQIDARLSEAPSLENELAELRTRELILAKLASLRMGPQFVLNELARILSNPRDVVSRKAAGDLEWSLSWDPESLVLKAFKDLGGGRVQLQGNARTMDDISEFWKRLKSSPIFRNVRLIEIKDSREENIQLTTQAFVFSLEANFYYQTKEALALVEMLTTEGAMPSNAEGANGKKNNATAVP